MFQGVTGMLGLGPWEDLGMMTSLVSKYLYITWTGGLA